MQEKFIVDGAMLYPQEAWYLARIWISIVVLAIIIVGLSVGADDRVVLASRILEQIRAGDPVGYEGSTIEGDLDIDKLDGYLPSANEALYYHENHTNLTEKKKIVASMIRITNCTVMGGVNFNNTRFDRPIDLRNTRFEGHAGFRGAIFKEDANLSNAQICQYADFLGSIFGKNAYFNEAQFIDYADFEGAYFDSLASFKCNFIDFADFGNADFNSTAYFRDADFNGKAYFRDADFNSTAYFWDADFNDTADFINASFNGTPYFGGAEFNSTAYFMSAGFNDKADFNNAGFNGTYFIHAGFNGTADFFDAGFNDTADFSDADFNGTANFRDAGFNDTADFSYAGFNDTADFIHAGFNDTAYFGGAEFNSTAYFMSAGFNGEAYFYRTLFNITEFQEAQFNKEAHFNGAQFTGTTSFDNARFKEDALFEDADFKGELSLSKARYNKLYIRWYNINSFVYDDTAYMALMKNFKDLGYYEDYDSCYFQYRKAHRDQPWPTMSGPEQFLRKTFIDYPLEKFNGYGTKPINAAIFSLAIVLIFALFWWQVGLGGPKDKTRESLKDRTGKSQEDDEEWLDGDVTDILAFSATVFLSGTRLFIDPPPLPRIEGKSRSMIKKAFILERVLGALFSVLFFIAISGTIARAS